MRAGTTRQSAAVAAVHAWRLDTSAPAATGADAGIDAD
jgi:hypothetical protein